MTAPVIYVDALQVVAGRKYCHMFCEDVAALHAFATRIGLKRCWFHGARWPHYDLSEGYRWQALRAGAVQATREQTVEIARKLERKPRRRAA